MDSGLKAEVDSGLKADRLERDDEIDDRLEE